VSLLWLSIICALPRPNLDLRHNQATAQQEVEKLNLQVQSLAKELSAAQAKAELAADTQPKGDASAAQAKEASLEPGEIKPDVTTTEDTSQATELDSQKALNDLQARFNEYKTEQSSKYEQGVMKVNSANVSFLSKKTAGEIFVERFDPTGQIETGESAVAWSSTAS
jgi:hypothetical protein